MLFKHAEIFTPQGFVRGAFTVEDGRFGEILPQSPDMPGTDLGGARVIPGLIDIHNHGNSGADFSDGDPDGIRTMARYLAKNGVTSFAPASMTLPYDVLARAFRAAADYNRAAHPGCARLMGIQMEAVLLREEKGRAERRVPPPAGLRSVPRALRGQRGAAAHRGCGGGAAGRSGLCRAGREALHGLHRAYRLQL